MIYTKNEQNNERQYIARVNVFEEQIKTKKSCWIELCYNIIIILKEFIILIFTAWITNGMKNEPTNNVFNKL